MSDFQNLLYHHFEVNIAHFLPLFFILIAFLHLLATEQAAGLDLSSPIDVEIPALSSIMIRTDIAICPPPGCYSRLATRSSSIRLGMTVEGGVIDRDFR